MKRKFLLIAASVALMASCTKQDEPLAMVQEEIPSSDIIGFRANTSRAATLTLDNIEGDATGFGVYATSTTTADGDTWFLDGSNKYKYTSPTWGWSGTSEQWPTDAATYPITFFALYAPTYTGITVETVTKGGTVANTADPLSADITIQAPAAQSDILAATVVADTKPSDGKLSMSFNHILSKVDVGIIPGYNKTIYVNYLAANNLDNSGTYSIGTKAWSATSGTFTTDYDISSALTSFTSGITGSDSAEKTATAITATADNKSLMLLPQNATASDTDTWVANVDPTGTLIEMRYRSEYLSSESGDMEDAIGYADASDHPAYNPVDDVAFDNKALFVKVGFPLSTAWTMGSNYTYNIRMGTADATNGYLLDDYFYDEDGNRTKFKIDFDKEPGDPISEGEINFDITVKEWVGESAQTL